MVESKAERRETLRRNLWPAAVMLALGFSSGLPYLLIYDTASVWLRQAGVSLADIGYFFLFTTFSYTLKFMWAPVIDRLNLPFLTQTFGHRRGWLLLIQILLVAGLLAISTSHPEHGIILMAIIASLTGFVAATQDIVMDAWRIEAVEEKLQGLMASCYQWGYRIALILAGVLPLVLAGPLGWNAAYAIMAGFMAVGIAAVLLAPREKAHTIRPIHMDGLPSQPWLEGLEWMARGVLIVLAAIIMGCGLTGNVDVLDFLLGLVGLSAHAQDALKAVWTAKTSGVFLQIPAFLLGFAVLGACCLPLPWATRPGAYFKGAFVAPVADFFSRYENWAAFILSLILVYRVSEFILNIMNPFYVDLGFSLDMIAGMRKVWGVAMSMLGLGLASWIIARFGLMKSLVIGAVVGPLSHAGFMWLACAGHDVKVFAIAMALDNISAGISGTVLIAYMSSLTSSAFTASQYALFSSLYSVLGKLVASQSGRIVEASAKAAHQGGVASLFTGLMGHLSADSYVLPALRLGVSPAALGAGYFTFFAYTIVIGFISILMSVWLYFRRKPTIPPEDQARDVARTS
ncbi:MFS transporter [Asticcacaulis sp. EMRT-3]|uniref:AmpG family muropeptide MFS transporter n=1 Tax=Asticcacaulis sp. EMRT-3 TaxID=3040349 RepID=UPI0024AFF5D3|nr:MFS transporter [Asticcacaulis sp. EMRT-3]MDI7775980.1 MFS transporter [Asticcacaulis sp. EMRT-3]